MVSYIYFVDLTQALDRIKLQDVIQILMREKIAHSTHRSYKRHHTHKNIKYNRELSQSITAGKGQDKVIHLVPYFLI